MEIRPLAMGWHPGGRDEPDDGADQCVHGGVELLINDRLLARAEPPGITLTTAGLYLLRTLQTDHQPGGHSLVTEGNLLFPCCGFTVLPGPDRCLIFGCPNGLDLAVTTCGQHVQLATPQATVAVPRTSWHDAVLRFVAAIEAFYASSTPRQPPADPHDAAGWAQFWTEWHQRAADASGRSSQPQHPLGYA